MFRICWLAFALYLSVLSAFGQTGESGDSSAYKTRKLKLDEVNFISSYYQQDGNNSAVTGGIGSEHLTDFATTLDVHLSKYDTRRRKHSITAEVGIDVYTSASSDKIDPSTISSASSGDKRIYPSLTYAIANEKKGTALSFTGSISTEFDYFSKGIGVGWSKLSKNRNREFSVRGQAFFDNWSVILPIELRPGNSLDGTLPRNSYSASFTLSQVVTRRMQVLLLTDVAWQEGQLATLYHRTWFTDGSHRVENLPDTRMKWPIGIRANFFAGDRIILRGYYRYYIDSWGLSAHTVELEAPIKVTPFLSVSPFYRFYQQKGVKYFAPYREHSTTETYYTSDFDLSTFRSNMMGMGIRYAPPGGILHIARLNAVELRYGHYDRSTGLNSDIVTLLVKYK